MDCPHCGKDIADHQAFCQYCGARAAGGPQHFPALRASRKKTPWEDREALGFFGGIVRTVRDALFSPSKFFKSMAVSGGLTDPLLFSLITGVAGLMVSYVWQMLLHGTMESILPPAITSGAGAGLFHGPGIAVMAVIFPLTIILWLFAWSGIVHLFLMMVNGARAGFEATFRAIAYSHGTYLFMALPFCGWIIAAVWSVVLIIIGLKEAHEISGGKAAFAELAPLAACCGAVVLGALFFGMVTASAGALMRQ